MRFFATILAAVAMMSMAAHAEVTMGDDGLHKADWLEDTFMDMSEDLESANAEGKRLLIIWEQRGCPYCNRMHEKIFPRPEIDVLLREHFYIVQMNLFGDKEVTDFDGTVLSEKQMAVRWGIIFTPTMMFLDDIAPMGKSAAQSTVMVMPGAFDKYTTKNILNFVWQKAYEGDEHFQKFHARELAAAKAAGN